MKSGRRKPVKPPRFPPPRASRPRAKPRQPVDQVAQLRRERDKAIEEQKATAEILEIIANSPGQLELIFSAILDRATGICGAKFGVMMLYEGEGTFRTVALHNVPLKLFKVRQRQPVFRPPDDNPLGRVVKTKRVYHMEDIRKEAAYLAGEQNAVILADDGGARSVVNVPMLRDGALLGAIGIYKKQVQPFTAHQIELVESFAKQAVIAIENARLLAELRQRTDDLSESLEQQTATSEVLRVISSSPGDLDPVFDAILENATRICEAKFGTLFRFENGMLRLVSQLNVPSAFADAFQRETRPLTANNPLNRIIATREPVHIADYGKDPAYLEGDPRAVAGVNLGGIRTLLVVPMFKDTTLVGGFGIYRQEVRPFTDKQVELVQNFANQAVIAIENTRLLNELRQRTDDLSELLEQQTATSEVLNVISSSLSNAQPVFDAIVQSGMRLFPDAAVFVALPENGMIKAAAMAEKDQARAEGWKRRFPFPLSHDYMHGVAILNRAVVDISDVRKAPPELAVGAKNFLKSGYLAVTIVPMMRGDAAIGALSVVRLTPGPLSNKQLAVLKNFAAQAVIAIENTRLLSELRQRTDDLTESLEQQTATSDVLKVISSSPAELEPVFSAVLENATRICGANFGVLFLSDGDGFRTGAMHNAPATLAEVRRREPLYRPPPNTAVGRMARTKRAVHVADILADKDYFVVPPGYSQPRTASFGGARTVLAVPMLKDDELVGAINIYRQEVQPFTDKQVELLANFAAQAVIAIENARLLNELRQRTDDLTESLEQQTAISDILRVISNSPSDVKPVFETVAERAARICEARFVDIVIADDDKMSVAATFGDLGRPLGEVIPLDRSTVMGRSICDKQPVHLHDQQNVAEKEYPLGREFALKYGHRTFMGVPLLREGRALGTILVRRTEVRPFEDRHVALLKTFADQAAIAIENARLFNELRQRTDDLTESLQQQTATADVLKVISRSAFDLQTVLDTLTTSAAQLCEADMAGIVRPKAGEHYWVTSLNFPPAFTEIVKARPILRNRGSVAGRALVEGHVVHIPDVLADAEFTYTEAQKAGGYRTVLGVPLLREGTPIGVIVLTRVTVRPFTDKQIELLSTFADQAVIAIENVRLFDEVQRRTEELSESLQQQTATADVLKVISRSTFDLKTVLDTLLKSAAHLCDADQGTITQRKGEAFYRSVAYGFPDAFLEYVKDQPVEANRKTGTGRALAEGKVVHIPDVHNDPEFDWPEAQKLGGFRTMLGVPMLREGEPVGVLTLTRADVRPFTEKQIELVATFADQAAIAIENVRLFDEIQDKSRQLAEASQHKSQFLANMSHELRTPLNAILGYTELIMDGIYGDTPDKMRDTLERVQRNGKHLLGLINDVLDLSKIEAGQLALSLGDYSLRQVVHDVYGAVESLAANKHIGLKVEMPNELPQGWGDERRLTQVLLNLVGNAIKFTDKGEVVIAASATNGSFLVAVRDTGPGISKSDQGKIFDEFQQADNSLTKAKGGTGLGLAIARRIMELHGGRLWVESEVGSGSTFTFTLPVEIEKQMRQA